MARAMAVESPPGPPPTTTARRGLGEVEVEVEVEVVEADEGADAAKARIDRCIVEGFSQLLVLFVFGL